MKKLLVAIFLLSLTQTVWAEASIASDGIIYRTFPNEVDFNIADAKALEACKKDSGKDCKIVARFSNGCWAVSKDRQLYKTAQASGFSTIEAAKSAAINNCQKAGGVNCIVTDNQGCEGSASNLQQSQPKAESANPSKHQAVDCNALSGWSERYTCGLKEQKLSAFRAQCDDWGFVRGTDEYSKCLMNLETHCTVQTHFGNNADITCN